MSKGGICCENIMLSSTRQAANATVLNNPWLELIEHDLYDISGRIAKIDEGYFIVYNKLNNCYEVHHTENKNGTYSFSVPYSELDCRTLDYCEQTLIAKRDKLIKDMEAKNAKLEEDKKRQFDRDMDAASRETASDMTLATEQEELHEGYKRTHFMGGI